MTVPAQTAQAGVVLVTSTILLMMVGLMASVSIRSSTLSLSLAASQRLQQRAQLAADAAIAARLRNGGFVVTALPVTASATRPHQLQLTVTSQYLGVTVRIPDAAFDAARDTDLRCFLFEITAEVQAPRGVSAAQARSLCVIGLATHASGTLPDTQPLAEQRFGKTVVELAARWL